MTQPGGENYIIVEEDSWNQYHVMRKLRNGSDIDGDSAYFWTPDDGYTPEELRSIRFEWCRPGVEWQSCTHIGARGAHFFPAHNWAKGVAGAFRSPLSFGLPYHDARYRVLLPKHLAVLTPPDDTTTDV